MDNASDQFTSLAPFYDELMQIVPYSDWVDYVLDICHRFDHEPHRVLDCACGTGNVTYELAARGLEAVGVDFSQEMIDVATTKSTFKGTQPRFFQNDLCNMELNQQFDTITCLYDSLNYLTCPERLARAFCQIWKHASPGGLFIFDMNTPYAFESNMFTQSEHRRQKKLHYDWTAHFDSHTRVCEVQMKYERLLENGSSKTFRETHYERSYSLIEIKQLLQNSGWEFLECFDSYRLTPARPRTERWFFVARKNHAE